MNRIRTTARNVAQLLLLWFGVTLALALLLFAWLALPNIGTSSEPAQQPIHPTLARSA